MRYFIFLIAALTWALPVTAADNPFSPEQSEQIIQNGLWLLGQADEPSEELAEALEEHVHGDHPGLKCGTPMLMDFKLVAPQDRRAATAAMLANPRPSNLELTYDSPGGHFKIHYTRTNTDTTFDAVYQPNVDSDNDGVPDYIEGMAMIADSVHETMINELGYNPPPDDSFYPEGGDARYDIYVRDLPDFIYGQTVPDSIILGQGPPLFQQATSFMELDNDYDHLSRYRDNPLEAVRVTVAHEYFHSVQFGYDYFETRFESLGQGQVFAARYWMEMSAVWMEEQIYDEINDYYAYLDVFFGNPRSSIQQFRNFLDLHPYASAIFTVYLVERYGPDIVRSIWERCSERGAGPDFEIAAQQIIDSASAGTESWASEFREFALWNYFTGERADKAPNGFGYEEGANYPEIPEEEIGRYFGYPVDVSSNESEYTPEHNAASYLRFEAVSRIKPRFWECNSGSFGDSSCTDSVEVVDTTGWDIFSEFNRIDTGFAVRLRHDTNGFARPWGLSIVAQLENDPDSFEVDRILLPVTSNRNFINQETPDASRFRSILYIISPASEEETLYKQFGDSAFFSYSVLESSVIDSALVNVPSMVMTPYPNPAVVAQMSDPVVHFRFRIKTDSTAFPIVDFPRATVDIFTIAGEYVTTIDRTVTSPVDEIDNAATYVIDWDMNNKSGKSVASGAYIAFARLYSDAEKTELLAEDKVKVAIIR
ncbi:hypothetical protein GF420_00480 [candidate division GN15 bacterium]|nr:hypothetical protein [candidate division GN15 bacterium]